MGQTEKKSLDEKQKGKGAKEVSAMELKTLSQFLFLGKTKNKVIINGHEAMKKRSEEIRRPISRPRKRPKCIFTIVQGVKRAAKPIKSGQTRVLT